MNQQVLQERKARFNAFDLFVFLGGAINLAVVVILLRYHLTH